MGRRLPACDWSAGCQPAKSLRRPPIGPSPFFIPRFPDPAGGQDHLHRHLPNYAATVNPQLSQKLTDELMQMFSSQTPLNVMTTDDGDLQLEGEITGYDTRAAALSSADEVSMNRLTITIKVRFTNTVDPDASFEQSFSRYRDYAASRDFSSVESSLVSEIVTELCEDVFNKSVVNW